MVTKEQINHVVDIIVKNVHPKKVVLFGSHADGSAGKNSDLDLLVITDTRDEGFKRTKKIRKYLRGTKIPIDIVVYTPSEVEEWKDTKSAFITQVLENGKVIYGQKDKDN